MSWRHSVKRAYHSFGISIGIAILSVGCLSGSVLLGQAPGSGDPAHFSYDAGVSLGVKQLSTKVQNDVTIQDVTYVGSNGDTVPAYLVIPQGTGKFAAIIWAHLADAGSCQFQPRGISAGSDRDCAERCCLPVDRLSAASPRFQANTEPDSSCAADH